MHNQLNRRTFMTQSAATGAALAAASQLAHAKTLGANDRIVIAVMGMKRGLALARTFANQENVHLKYVCEVDEKRGALGASDIEKRTKSRPEILVDFRKALDDPEVDVLVCAAPNHWHGPATIMACNAGKHVYVEKPACHNPQEGEWMIEAAKKNHRCVQVGMQRRSFPAMIESIQELHDGLIGRIFHIRSWYNNNRQSIGIGKPVDVPSNLDFDLWQGPAPRTTYVSNLVPYNWHWFWQWGNGELGNNGVHNLDICRWALGVDVPSRVTSIGGRYKWNDDQQTPDTQTVCFEYEDKGTITWQGLSCQLHRPGFVSLFGDKGAMDLNSDGTYVLYDKADKVIRTKLADGKKADESAHVANFLSAVRSDDAGILHAPIQTGHVSALMCHLGNMSQRTGDTIRCDASTGKVVDNPEAMKLWQRKYEPGWEPKV